MRRGKYRYGTRNPSSKLDEGMVRMIRSSPLRGKELAAMLNVSHPTISHIRNRNTWAWLP